MNYRIHKFLNDVIRLTQDAINDGVPVYVVPYLFKDLISTLAPTIEQAVKSETPQNESEWHLNEENK